MELLKGIALESEAGQVQHCRRSGGPEMPLFDKSEVFMQVQRVKSWGIFKCHQ